MADNLSDDAIKRAVLAARKSSNLVTEADVYEPSIGEKLASIPQSLYEIGTGLPGAISRYVSSVPERFSAATERVKQMSPSEFVGALGSSAGRMIEPYAQAATLAGRTFKGEVPPERMIPEALNYAGAIALGGIPASALEKEAGVMLGTSGTKTVPQVAENVAKRRAAVDDAALLSPQSKTVDQAVQIAEQANKDLAPEAIAKTVAVEPTVTPPVDKEHAQITEVGHQMGTERGERKTIKEENIRLTPEEKEIVNSFESPFEKAKVAGAIRATKARYPVSDGWAPLQLVDAKLNEKGLPELQWQQPAYGFNRAMTNVERPVTDATGQKVMEPKKDRAGNILMDDFGNPIMSSKPVKMQVQEERSMKRGTPEYDKSINKAVKNSYDEIEDVVRRAAEGDEAAKVILRQVGWYREFMRKGFDERGGAYPAFSDILGATSPNTAVDQNYRYAVEAQQRFARGDFDPQVAFAANYQGNLTKFPEEQLIRREVVDPKTGEYKQYGMNSRNAQMAMADLWRQQEEGQAPKARNFSGNLGGATDAATIDVWAARHIQRMLGRKRLPPPAEGGVKGKMMMSAPDNPVGPYGPMPMTLKAGGEFGFGQDMYGKLADKVNQSQLLKPYLEQLGYDNITPMDLQALTWFIEKEHWTKNNWTTKSGEGGSFEDEMSKFPSSRWQSGFSITQDKPPSDEMMAQARNVIEGSLKNDDDVMVYRVHPTYGRYGGADERSFDVELTAKPDWNPTNWMASIIGEAQKNNQYDVFFSKRLDPSAAQSNPNARPGVEIYFQNRKDMQEILPILDEFTRRGQDGFTFTTDLRHRERQSGGADTPDYVGVRLQYIPEIRMRFDEDFRNAVVNDPQVLQDDLKSALDNMQNAIDALDKSGAKIVDARVHHYDTLTVGKESYDDFLKGIADLENAAPEYERSARGTNPVARFGRPISSHVEGRDRALRAGTGEGSANASAAMEQSNPIIEELKKARGGSAFATGGRTMGNNAIDNAIRVARLSDDKINMPQSLKELQNWKKTHPSKGSMDKAFSARASGFEGAPSVAMPANIDELLAYLRGQHASGGRAAFGFGGDSDAAEGSSYTENIRNDYTPSFREAETQSMNDLERAYNTGEISRPTERDSTYIGQTNRGLPEDYTPAVDVGPYSFGKTGVTYDAGTSNPPTNIREYTRQRLETTPDDLYQAASNPSLYYGMGYPSTVGIQPTRAGAAGLLGTLYGESEYDPTAINPESGAVGMAQYLGTRKDDFLRAMGIDTRRPTDAELKDKLADTQARQMGYIINEMLKEPSYELSEKQYLTGTNPEKVAGVITKNFERPSEQEIIDSAARRAAEALSIYSGEPPTSADTFTGSPAANATGKSGFNAPTGDTIAQAKAAATQPSVLDKLFGTNEDRIAGLEANNRYYGGDRDAVAAALGVDPDQLKARIVMDRGQQAVDYYTKDLSDMLKEATSDLFGRTTSSYSGPKGPNMDVVNADIANRAAQERSSYGPYGDMTREEYRQMYGGNDAAAINAALQAAQTTTAQPAAATAPYLTELSKSNLALPNTEGMTAQQWADTYAGGDLSKVHARIVYRQGAPRLEYYMV